MTRATGSAGLLDKQSTMAKQVIDRICPTTLPYEIGTPASFALARFNGRALADDVMDVILTIATNTPLGDGVAPDTTRIRTGFPYFGEPYSAAEQVSVTPVRQPPKA